MPSSGCKKSARSEEHTSELQSHDNLVCRLLLEKKKKYDERSLIEVGQQIVSFYIAGVMSLRILNFHNFILFFFLKDPATPEIYPLPLHDALPISRRGSCRRHRARGRGRASASSRG